MVGWYGGGQMRLACLQPAESHSLIIMITPMMTIKTIIRIVCTRIGEMIVRPDRICRAKKASFLDCMRPTSESLRPASESTGPASEPAHSWCEICLKKCEIYLKTPEIQYFCRKSVEILHFSPDF